jgi:hypothetical protein
MRTRVTLRQGSWERQAIVEVPAGPCRPDEVVPALHQLADAISVANIRSIYKQRPLVCREIHFDCSLRAE